jgi:hypothetical protein
MSLHCPACLERLLRNNTKAAAFLISVLFLSAFTCNGEVFEDDDVLRNTGLLQADWIGVVDIVSIDDMPVEATANPPTGDDLNTLILHMKPVSTEDLLKVKVSRVLYGRPDPPAKVVIDRFQSKKLQSGDRCLLFLSFGRVVSRGIVPYAPEVEQRIAEIVSGMSSWSSPQAGMKVAVMPSRIKLKENENLHLYFKVRNVSTETVRITYPGLHTYWNLLIRDETGKTVEARRLLHYGPLYVKQWARRQGHHSLVDLDPGESRTIGLDRVNSSSGGWGSQGDLDFSWYPMPPGTYSIRARAVGLMPGRILESEPVEVVVTPAEPAAAIKKLPYIDDLVELSPSQTESLLKELRVGFAGGNFSLSDTAERTIMDALPRQVVDACNVMPERWGLPGGTESRLRVRPVYLYRKFWMDPRIPQGLLLAVRCEAGNRADERLAAVSVVSRRGLLLFRGSQFRPDGTDSLLTDIRAVDTMQADHREIAVVSFKSTNENPCGSRSCHCSRETAEYLLFEGEELLRIGGHWKSYSGWVGSEDPGPGGSPFSLTMQVTRELDGNVLEYDLVDADGTPHAHFEWDNKLGYFDGNFDEWLNKVIMESSACFKAKKEKDSSDSN